MPRWSQRNLQRHYNRHPGGKDKDCWTDVLGKSQPVTVQEYEQTSLDVVNDCWLCYQAEESDPYDPDFGYYPRRTYFVDDRILKTVTDANQQWIVTCYHEHYDRPHEFSKNQRVPLEQRRLEFKKHLEWDEQGLMIQNLKVLRDET